MYKILLTYGSSSKNLWTPYMVEKVETDENEVETTTAVEYETDSEEELETTIIKLLEVHTTKDIRIVEDKTYTIDLLF